MKQKEEIQNYHAWHLWITEHLSAILMSRSFINLSWQVTSKKQSCGNISAAKGNFHEQQWLQLNQYGKTHQEHNETALRNCKHQSLSCNIIFPVLSSMGHAIKRSRAAVKLHLVCPPLGSVGPFNKAFSSLRIQGLVQNHKRFFYYFQPENKPICTLEWFSALTLCPPLGEHLEDGAVTAAGEGLRKPWWKPWKLGGRLPLNLPPP